MELADITRAIPGDPRYLQTGIGFEPASRAARLILLAQLNKEIEAQNLRWRDADLELDALGLDPGVGYVEAQPIETRDFHEGPKKSLIEAPPERFPNVTVMAYMTVPSASQFIDQGGSSDITLFVEAMAISGPVPDTDDMKMAHETIVHRRIQRMTDAIAIVIERNPTLLGTIHELKTPPRGGVGNSTWLRPKSAGAGPKYIWHGSRLQYTTTRHHANP